MTEMGNNYYSQATVIPINKMNVEVIIRQQTTQVKTNKQVFTMPVERGINLNSLYNKTA